ncbi:MAG: arsenic transporter [Bacilli bacterium]|nr:arsenic transporter [Bacilli bacterium]
METITVIALVHFLITYVLLLALPKYRPYVALVSALIFVIYLKFSFVEVFYAIDWNVILMIAGTMGMVYLFIESKMPALIADKIIVKTPNVKWAIIALSLLSGIISAFVDNVATVLMLAPIALTISKKLGISPVKSIIAIAIASNLQGAATLVGDTTSILLSSHAGLNFLDFFYDIERGKIGMFFVVQAGALAATLILFLVFRKDTQKIETGEITEVEDYGPTVLLVLMIVLLIMASFIEDKPQITNGLITMGLFVIGVFYNFARTYDRKVFVNSIKSIDYFTILLLMGLFVVIEGITKAGVVDEIAKFISKTSTNPFIIFTIIVWASVLISAFVDNIPYVATMLPVTAIIANKTGVDPFLLYYGLLCGATLGGNLTPIGASANITGIGILRKEGYEVSAGQFMKISLPFTLAAVTTGYILVWLIWH